MQQLPDFCMPLDRDRVDRRCWNLLLVLDLAGDSNHLIIPLFCFTYFRLNTSTIQAVEVDPEADKESNF